MRRSRSQLDAVTTQASANSGGSLGPFQVSVERLRRSLTNDVEKLGQTLESRIKSGATGSAGGSHYDDEFAALSDRLMRSSAHLDRMLARLEDVLEAPMNGNGSSRDAHTSRGGGSSGMGRGGRGAPRPITRIGP